MIMTIWTIEQEQRFLELRCMEAVTLETDPKLTELHKLREQRDLFIQENFDAPKVKAHRDRAIQLLRDSVCVMNAHAVGFKTQEVIKKFTGSL